MIKKVEEVWRPYPDFPFIEASNLGRIRTKDRWVTYKNGAKHFYKGRVLKQRLNPNGYMRVGFSVNSKHVNLSVHRVIAKSHLPNPDNFPEVNHIDCDPTNNLLENLEWCTHQENIAYCVEMGHWVNNNPSHPVIVTNPETSDVLWFESQAEAARQLGVDQSHVAKVIKGKLNKTGSCWFCHADEKAVEKARTKFGDEIAEKVEKLISEHI